MIISPSILACDFLNIQDEIKVFETHKNIWLHLDVMDGHFVPNMTFGLPIISALSKNTKTPLDVHLMVTNPEFYIEQIKANSIHNLTFHLEAVSNPIELIKKAKLKFKSIGISIKPATDVTSLTDELLKLIDLVLIMSVEPGFGGQSFMENSISKISYLANYKKKNNCHFQVQVDGGIDDNTSKLVKAAGANNLVAGSYIFKNESSLYIEKVNSLK